VGKVNNHSDSATRQQLLLAALKNFAERGYAATSVQQIVDEARVSKPALYYYFSDKAKLFEALVDQAHEQRYRLLLEAVELGTTVAEKLEEIAAAILKFSLQNRELMRLAFVTAFAASGETPARLKCQENGKRNFELIRSLMVQGQAAGELQGDFTADELAMGIFGQLNSYIMVRLLMPDWPVDREAARRIVQLFMQGAGSRERGAQGKRSAPGKRVQAQN
jgi:AcrR family transcriptional regulator